MEKYNSFLGAPGESQLPSRMGAQSEASAYAIGWDETEDPKRQFRFDDYWRLLLRHKGALVLAGIVGVLTGLLISLPQTAVYRAETSIEIQSLNEGFLGFRDVNPTNGGPGYIGPDLATQVEIIQSRRLISQTVEKLSAAGQPVWGAKPGRLAAWRMALGIEELTAEERRRIALAMASQTVRASLPRESRIVRIAAESTEPTLAALFANTLAKEYIAESIESRWESTQYTEDWLERQLDELRIKLEDAEDRLQQAAHASGLILTGDEANVAEEQLRQLQQSLSEARADRIAKQSKYELALSSPPEALPDVLDSSPLSHYHVELNRLRQELANLTSTFTESYPRVKPLRAQIAQIEETMKRESANIIERIKNEFQASLRREKLLEADYTNQTALVSEQGRKAIQYNILKREVETTRQLYENLLQKGKEARLAAAMKASPVRVVDEAVVPSLPVKPNHFKNSLLGLFAGLALGVVILAGRERVDRTIKDPGDAEFYIGAHELGIIPSVRSERWPRRFRPRLKPGSAAKEDNGKGVREDSGSAGLSLTAKSKLGSSGQNPVELATWCDRTSLAAEAFQATLTSILFSGTNGDVPRRLVITSPSPGEGKTTVASNLAIALSEANQRVLVVDADMRKPRLHGIFDVPNGAGLSDLLRRREPLSMESMEGIAQETAVPGVYVLPSGSYTSGVANLLHSRRTRELLDLSRGFFDWIVIDTPPMTQLSDARLLARKADAVVLVVKAGATSRDAAAIATQRLRKDGSRVLGVVLNHWNPKVSRYGYYNPYYSYAAQDQEPRAGSPVRGG